MRVLIVEDEFGAARNLCDILKELEPGIEILTILETVKDTVEWLKNNPSPELGFFDIRLADGNSFQIFEHILIDFPIIFTTAFDEYALKAFKVNSVDYLLKPIDKKQLHVALTRYKTFFQKDNQLNQDNLLSLINDLKNTGNIKYKKNFLVYIKDKILPVSVNKIAYFFLENEIVYCLTYQNQTYIIDQSLDKIAGQLNPEEFYRANRQCIISRESVKSAANYFNRKLKLELQPKAKIDVLISKTKASEFKKWLGGELI